MGRARRTLAIVALTATLVSCNGPIVPASTPTTTSDSLHMLTTSATLPLAAELVSAYSQSHHLPGVDIRSGSYEAQAASINAEHAPYILTHYLPADSPFWAAPIGQDGIAVIAHPSIDITNLSEAQLRDIYQGRINRWESLGGPDADIVVFSREKGSGTRSVFQRLVMGRRQTTPNALIALSSEQMLQAISQTAYSIGFISGGYLNSSDSSSVHMLTINNVPLSAQNVATSRYPLRTTLFIAGVEDPTGVYRAFIGWLQSAEGQAVVANHYVPLVISEDG